MKFLAGSKKIYNNIKFTYYTPTTYGRKPNAYAEYQYNRAVYNYEASASAESVAGSSARITSMSRQAQASPPHDEDSRIDIIRDANNNYKMPELFEKNITRIGQCDKLCNGVQTVYLNRCRKSGDQQCRPMLPETRSCNTDCDLRYVSYTCFQIPLFFLFLF